MKCPTCTKALVVRNGKFGEFLCCPSSHGTFSIQNGTMYFTGAVGQMLKNAQIEKVYSQLRLQQIDSYVAYQPSLTQLMNAQLASWGWNSGGEMEQLAEYAVGEARHATIDEDHWSNIREY